MNHIEEPVFRKFDEKENTINEKEDLFAPQLIVWDVDLEIDESVSEEKVFLQGVIDHLNKHFGKNYHINEESDRDSIIDEVKEYYRKKGIPFEKSVRNWLIGKVPPSHNQAYKKNCYNFCIALGMNLHSTAEFMFKYFQVMPFNYKSRIDAIYYYSLLNKKDYKFISELIERTQEFKTINDDINTQSLGRTIKEIDSDEEFISYLETHCYDSEHQLKNARNIADDLILQNKALIKTDSTRFLLQEIKGFDEQIVSLSKGKLNKEITESFPNNIDISKIKDGNISEYALRKIIILMKFYNYYRELKDKRDTSVITDEKIYEYIEEFVSETDDILAECGYVMLYPRNKYDALILRSANSVDPTETLKKILKKYIEVC